MNPYEVLGVDGRASPGEIRSAYLRLASQNHPDRGGDAEAFRMVNDAYERLAAINAPSSSAPKPSQRIPVPTLASGPNPLFVPATILLIGSILWLSLSTAAFGIALSSGPGDVGPGLGFALTLCFFHGCTLLGSICMLQCKHRWLAITGSVIASMPCSLFLFPIGIWAVYLLTEDNVKKRFQRNAR